VARTGAKKSRPTCEAQAGARGQETGDGIRAAAGRHASASFRACIALLKAAQRERQPGRALDAFLITLRPAALDVIRRHVPPPRDEDLAQELLLRVSKAYRRIQPERCPGYLVTAAYNLARREHKGYPLGAVLLTASAEALDVCRDLVVTESPAEALEAAERLELIHRAVFALPTADLRDEMIVGEWCKPRNMTPRSCVIRRVRCPC
jgi:DNA-directed RNA polymerase specialized sigma24 family protein